MMTVRSPIPERVSRDRIWSLKCCVTGRSNPEGLALTLKVITLVVRSHLDTQQGQQQTLTGPRGMLWRKIRAQFCHARDSSGRLCVIPSDKVRFFGFAQGEV